MIPEEKDLIIRAQRGDKIAFERLIFNYDKKVLGIAFAYTRNSEDAKDIYQDVFIRVFKALKKFEFRSEFSTWLYRIATNVCLTFKSKQKKYAFDSIDESVYDNEEGSRPFSETIAGDFQTDEAVYSFDLNSKLEEALSALSPQQRMAFTLKHYRGYKIKEIAGIMGCADGTIKNYLFNATQKVRELLKDYVK